MKFLWAMVVTACANQGPLPMPPLDETPYCAQSLIWSLDEWRALCGIRIYQSPDGGL